MNKPVLMVAYTNYRRDPRVKREAEALAEAGHRVTFLASRHPGQPDRETIEGVEVIKLRSIGHRRTSIAGYLLDYAFFFLQVFVHCTLAPRRYALIHVNNMPDFLVFATLVPRLLGTPVIHDVHDLMPELYGEKFAERANSHWLIKVLLLQERWAGRFASAVLTVEDRLKDILSRRGIAASKISVLMNLPDDRIFKPVSRRPVKPADAPFVMVYHGTLARRLGLDVAIEALALASPRIARAQLRIIGAGEERERLISLCRERGLQDKVSFSDGYVPVESIPGLLADADVGLVPLRISGGTDIMLPTKLLEYVLLGIPCIVPRTGTIARYFDAGMVQFFEAENAQSLAEAMVALYLDPARREQLARESSERFASRYSWRRHKRDYVDLVARLLGARPMPR